VLRWLPLCLLLLRGVACGRQRANRRKIQTPTRRSALWLSARLLSETRPPTAGGAQNTYLMTGANEMAGTITSSGPDEGSAATMTLPSMPTNTSGSSVA
jgi:hypothetical protein